MPERAAKLTVGDTLEPGLFLQRNDIADGAILDLAKGGRGNIAASGLVPSRLQFVGT